jgi:hypothetical protein
MSEQEIKNIFSDEAYVSSLLALETAEEVQASLAEKGLDLSATEITTLLDSIQKHAQSGEELSEADLETVTGGLIGTILVLIWTAVMAVGIGQAIASTARRRW